MRGEQPAASQSAYPAARLYEATAVSTSTGCWFTPEITVAFGNKLWAEFSWNTQ